MPNIASIILSRICCDCTWAICFLVGCIFRCCRMPGFFPDREGLVQLSYLPFYHIMTAATLFITALARGHTSVILPGFDPSNFLETVPKYKVNSLTFVLRFVGHLCASCSPEVCTVVLSLCACEAKQYLPFSYTEHDRSLVIHWFSFFSALRRETLSVGRYICCTAELSSRNVSQK